ncbi:hypothetical protein PIB30_026879 [Stylosanthes scabra]|uniref:Aminotransferase-like plant mobile domain-containing protein n=1 Tax=Stylosanthes scabra TaxID=79078 RepID=A0ABU6U990_9FABA|nr:hypothetical protein [Stylosanthes scabra]
MGPRKEIQRKNRQEGEGSSRRREQVHKLPSWFNNPQALDTYITKWEKKQFVAQRYITFDFIVGHNYRRLIDVIENQDRVIPLATIPNLCGLSMEGYRFMGGIKADESWGPYALQRGLSAIGYNDPIVGRERPSVHKLSTEMRILHYLITYTLLPRGGNHGILQHDDTFLMWAMLEGHKICWPFIMVQNMLRLQGRESKHIGYGPVWTRIFEHLGINLDGYRKLEVGEVNCINERTLKQMRRQLEQPAEGVDEVEEEIDRMEQEEEAQRQQEGTQGQQPQEQETMFDLVQEMRSMTQNLQAFQMETRGQYEDMNTRLGRVERGVRAIHDYIGIEYEMKMKIKGQDDHEIT